MDVYLQGIAQILGPEALGQYINIREYMDRRASALGIDTANLVRSEEELAMMQQQQQQASMAQQMAPQAGQIVSQQMEAMNG